MESLSNIFHIPPLMSFKNIFLFLFYFLFTSMQSFHLALLTCKEVSFEILKAVSLLIHAIEIA